MACIGFIRTWIEQGTGSDLALPLTVVLLLAGLALIIKGGDWFVDSAAWIAEISGIPKLIVGATVVSLATTLPELLVSSFAAAEGNVSISIGNAVGSVTANIGLVLAIGLIFMPCAVKKIDYAVKSALMLGGGVLLFFLTFTVKLHFLPSLVLIVVFIVFAADNVIRAVKEQRAGKRISDTVDVTDKPERRKISGRREIVTNVAKFVLGVAGIVIGADLLSENGEAFALQLGVPPRIVAITVIAIGTSLPELVTTITAVVKKQNELSFGNVIGANIIDIALILPVSAAISKGGVLIVDNMNSVLVDIPVMLGLGAIALVPMLITGKFKRWQGIALLGLYVVYIALMAAGVVPV
ncbi:MAG: calcium/sodium antiporter [Clostridia bacterium]|nr:calcium/sodium antiporter [Clostridia bacterium]